ncbi:MAG: ribosomal protein S18-alanine N-acetyltransferase [Burkholderiaceae bacterium]
MTDVPQGSAGSEPVSRPRPMPVFDVRRMTPADLPEVARIERSIYDFPWTLGNFSDALSAGYDAWAFARDQALHGYAVVMWLPDEVHLLNVSVAAPMQGQGHGRAIMRWLMANVSGRGAPAMMLEVRPSNQVARALYDSLGFRQIGLRRRYYPAPGNTREDALVLLRRFDHE